jgi:HK97 family phage major capsid protein
MATFEIKEIQDVVTEELKKNLTTVQKEISEGNQKTLKEATEAIELARKESATLIETTKTQLQKDYDVFALAMKEAQSKNVNGKPLNFGQAFSKTMKDGGFEGIQNAIKSNTINGHTIELKDFGTAQFTGYEAFNTDYMAPITSLYDQFHWRNIIPNGGTSKEFISFPKQGATTGNANAWDYGVNPGATVTKPVITPTMTAYTAKVEWIAGIIKYIEVSMLEDFAWANTFLSTLLREELLQAEDNQILNGSGVSPQLDGILANSVAYNGTFLVGIERIIDAAYRQLGDNFLTPTAIVMSNTDKVRIILNKATTSGEYNLPTGAIGYANGVLQLDGIPVYSTPQLAAGTAIVGDFNQAMLAIRSAPRLRIFDQNEDDATKNYLMMRIEERIALAIRRDNAFVNITFAS